MADMLKNSSDIGIKAREAQLSDGPSTSSRQNAVNRLRRHLSRTITQPRGLYESIIGVYGPISAPDVLQAEASQVDEAYKSLHASCSSDTETCSSYEDGQETHLDSAHDRKDEPETRGGKDHTGQSSRSRRRNEPQKRSDQEWAKSILSRRTGYGSLQRNQVVKYISQLETSLGELQVEVSNLSPQVILLDQRRWILQEENDTLKQKLAELSRYQRFKEDQNSALQKELQLLRTQRAVQLQQAERQQQEKVPNSKEGPHNGSGDEGEARADLAIAQEHSHDQSGLSDKQTTQAELEGLPHMSTEGSRTQEKTSSLRSNSSSQKESQAERKVSRQLSLVKWPSSLYRSVSAIRKDVLEVAIEESTVK